MVRMVILWLMVLVMTNTGCLPGSANGGGKGNVSHFKPFSEFLDKYIIDQEISQYVGVEWLLWDRTPFARIVSIFDRDTGENLCAKVIYKRFCSPTGLLVLDPQVLTSIRHKNIIKYYDIYESEEERKFRELQTKSKVCMHNARRCIIRIILAHQPRRDVDSDDLCRRSIDKLHNGGEPTGQRFVETAAEESVDNYVFGCQFREDEL